MAHLDYIASGDNFITSQGFQYRVYGEIPVVYESLHLFLYQTDSDPRTVRKNLSPATELKGTLRSGTSILNPIITIQSGTFFQWNYVYIREFSRYYFITDIVSPHKGLYELHLKCDVLMTYKTAIRGLTTRVLRSESMRDGSYTDGLIPTHGDVTTSILYPFNPMREDGLYSGIWNPIWTSLLTRFVGTGYIQVKLACSKVNNNYLHSLLGYCYLTMTLGGLWYLMDALRMMGFGGDRYKLTDTILEVNWCPTGWIGRKGNEQVTSIQYINWAGISEYVPNLNAVQAYVCTFTPSILGTNQRARWLFPIKRMRKSVNYRNRPPYRTLSLLFQPFGQINLDGEKYGNADNIMIELESDSLTGNANLYAFPLRDGYAPANYEDNRDFLASGNLNVPINIVRLENDFTAGISSLVGSLAGLRADGAQDLFDIGRAGLNGISALTQPPHASSVSGRGGGDSLTDIRPYLLIYDKEQNDPNPSTQGYLLNKTVKLANLSGYCLVDSGVHIESQTAFGMATKTEMDEIESLLTSGVILPSGD